MKKMDYIQFPVTTLSIGEKLKKTIIDIGRPIIRKSLIPLQGTTWTGSLQLVKTLYTYSQGRRHGVESAGTEYLRLTPHLWHS